MLPDRWVYAAAPAPLLLRPATLAVAGLMGLVFVGYVKGLWGRESIDTPAQLAALRERLPAGVELVSLGVLDPVFAHYWGDYIDWRDVPRPALEAPEDESVAARVRNEVHQLTQQFPVYR